MYGSIDSSSGRPPGRRAGARGLRDLLRASPCPGAHVLDEVFARRPREPRRLVAERLVPVVQAPEERARPRPRRRRSAGPTATGTSQTRPARSGWRRGSDVECAPSARASPHGWREAAGHRQRELVARGVGARPGARAAARARRRPGRSGGRRDVERPAQRVRAERHTDDAFVRADAPQLLRRSLGYDGADQREAEQPLVTLEPVVDRPVIGGAP